MDRKNLPEDAVLVCPACGRTAQHPKDFNDVACVINSVLCYEDKNEDGEWIPYEQNNDTKQ